MTPDPASLTRLAAARTHILRDIYRERVHQLEKFGDQRHRDGTGQPGDADIADSARVMCQLAARNNAVTWRHILWEETAEAFAETEPGRLRAELVQVAAVAAAWLEDLDRRGQAQAPAVRRCVAGDCPIHVFGRYVMCPPHWRLVPRELRQRINVAYRPGQTGQTASQEYVTALAEAIKAIEGLPVEPWHLCPIDGCGQEIPASRVVCHSCWCCLPPRLQRAVAGLRTAPGQEPDPARVQEVLDAATRAVRTAAGAAR